MFQLHLFVVFKGETADFQTLRYFMDFMGLQQTSRDFITRGKIEHFKTLKDFIRLDASSRLEVSLVFLLGISLPRYRFRSFLICYWFFPLSMISAISIKNNKTISSLPNGSIILD
jgi:hypothetical protein